MIVSREFIVAGESRVDPFKGVFEILNIGVMVAGIGISVSG